MLEINSTKQTLIKRATEENEATKDILFTIIHLLTVVKKTYPVMSKIGGGTISLGSGSKRIDIDIFSKDFINDRIKPECAKLQAISPASLTDCVVPKGELELENFIDYVIAQRKIAIEKAETAKKYVDKFLEHYGARTQAFAPIAYFQLFINLSSLLRDVQTILDAAHLQVPPLHSKNEFYKEKISVKHSGATGVTSFFATPSSVSQLEQAVAPASTGKRIVSGA